MQISCRRGFGLVELALVVLILAGLISITIFSYGRITTSNAVNNTYLQTNTLIDSFRQYISAYPTINGALIAQYANNNLSPRALQVVSANPLAGATFNYRGGLTWQLTGYSGADCGNCFNVHISNFPTDQSCALSARKLLHNSRSMKEFGVSNFAINNGAITNDPNTLADVAGCTDLALTLTKNN